MSYDKRLSFVKNLKRKKSFLKIEGPPSLKRDFIIESYSVFDIDNNDISFWSLCFLAAFHCYACYDEMHTEKDRRHVQ